MSNYQFTKGVREHHYIFTPTNGNYDSVSISDQVFCIYNEGTTVKVCYLSQAKWVFRFHSSDEAEEVCKMLIRSKNEIIENTNKVAEEAKQITSG